MKRILPLLVTLIILPLISSCGESKAKKEERERIEKARQDSIRLANERQLELERQKKEFEARTFTTSKGTYDKEKAIEYFYNFAADLGAGDQKYHYHFNGNGTDEDYKNLFVWNYGMPTNDKAKSVYDEGLKAYKKGYEDGFNFK